MADGPLSDHTLSLECKAAAGYIIHVNWNGIKVKVHDIIPTYPACY